MVKWKFDWIGDLNEEREYLILFGKELKEKEIYY